MRLIHTHLAKLADVCASSEHSRFGATTGVELDCREDGYVAAATDGRRLIVVESPYAAEPDGHPLQATLAAAPNGQTKTVIDGPAWAKAMRAAGKMTVSKRGKPVKPECRAVAVVQGTDVTTLGATDGHESQAVETLRNVEGRFPNWRQVTPVAEQAEYRIDVDPWYLAETLLAVASIGCDEESKRVELRFFGPRTPLTITATSPNQPRTTGVVVPLLPPDSSPTRASKLAEIAAVEENIRRMKLRLEGLHRELPSYTR